MEMPPGASGIILANVARMEELVNKALERDIDFGTSPGVPQPYLWDSGAAKIMAAFNLYPQHKVLLQTENEKTGALTVILETSLVSRSTGQVVATGVGAASGLEVKNKYRWVSNPEEYGQEKIGLKTRQDGGRIDYRILNPEFGEQIHNLMKSAAKRSEIDAVQSLPGVLPALRKLGKLKIEGKGTGIGDISLTAFWTVAKGMDYTEETAYLILGIKSLKSDWLDKGKRLTDAIDLLAKAKALSPASPVKAEPSSSPPANKPVGVEARIANLHPDYVKAVKETLIKLGVNPENFDKVIAKKFPGAKSIAELTGAEAEKVIASVPLEHLDLFDTQE